MHLRHLPVLFFVVCGTVSSLASEPGQKTVKRTKAPAIDRLDEAGFSQLHHAVKAGDLQRVRELLQDGANPNVRQAEFQGTPLQYASATGNTKVIEELIEFGAQVDLTDTHGRTPLMWAAMKNQSAAAKLLISADADLNRPMHGSWTALHYAAQAGSSNIAQLLVDSGANVWQKNSHGQTAVDINRDLEVSVPWAALKSQP